MACFHPREIVVNKPKLVYSWTKMSDGTLKRSSKPFAAAGKYTISVPCGKCPACLALAQSQWSFRIEREALYGNYASVLFVTFTYDNEHLPSDFGLHKSEMQKYFHDLRQNIDRTYGIDKDFPYHLRYYVCGEYGSRRGRPHFHCILYLKRSIDWKLIQSSWSKGIVDIREFTPARAGYVAKYSVKQLELDYEGRPRPFHMQSRGLGKCWLDSCSITIEGLNYNGYFANLSGRKVKLPRYYLDKLIPKEYKVRKDALGNVHRTSVLFGSSNPHHFVNSLRFSAYSEQRFLENERTSVALSGSTFSSFWLSQRQNADFLEQQLLKLQKKSSYYVKTDYELRFSESSICG